MSVSAAARPRDASVPRFGHAMRAEWALDPDLLYLNHGTVGATPRRVLEAQARIRERIELQPARFLLRELTEVRVGGTLAEPPRMRVAADRVARFLGARGDDLVFVDNATAGVNAVLRSLDLAAGDEILISDLAYGGVRNVARFVAERRGARVREIETTLPLDPGALVEAWREALGPRTRVAMIDHVTAETALLLPVAAIAAECRARGIAVLVDGAHAPGALALDVPALGVDWYAGNLHKWAWAPRSSGILWAAPERQAGLHPPVISWGLGRGFTAEFDLPGTRDPSPHLAAPAAIAFLEELGVEAVRDYDQGLARQAGRLLAERFGTFLAGPESALATMATVALPTTLGASAEDAARLRDALLFEDRIEVQVHAGRGRLWARVSAQIYNALEDYERLAAAIAARA